MATVAQIRADLVGSSASFRTAMIDGKRQAVTSLGAIRTEVKSTAESISLLNKAAAGIAGFEGLKAGVESLLEAQKAAQQIHYTLLSATGSTVASNGAYTAVSAEVDKLGLDLKSTALSFSQMSAAAGANGISMQQQIQVFDGLARSATVLHLSSEVTERAITAISQSFGKGKFQAEELRQQLGEAIPGVVPRFQQAVLAMNAGTNLAGESFDKLLQDGDLAVQRYLPALIQALNETGTGAEQASTGLNSAANRLSTAWFKLKSDLSGGVFSDAATASVQFMAQNLERVARAAGLASVVFVSRFASKGIDTTASSVAANFAERQAAVSAAQATDLRAQASIRLATAQQRQAEAAARSAGLDVQAAQRDVANAASTDIRGAALERLNAATALEVKANAELYVSNQRVVASDLAAAESASALATARSRTGVAGAVSGAANSALGLLGGPTGAAIAGIAIVGYQFAESRSEAKKLQDQTDENAKSVKEIADQASNLKDEFAKAGASDPFSKIRDSMAGISAQMDANRKQIADQQAQIEANAAGLTGGAPDETALSRWQRVFIAFRAGGAAIDFLSGKQSALRISNASLAASNDSLLNSYSAEQQQLIKAYAGSWDGVAASLGKIDLSADGVVDWLGRLSDGVSGATKKMADIDAARAQWQQYSSTILGIATDLEKKLRQKDMTPTQRLQDDLKTARAAASKGGVPDVDNSPEVASANRALAAQKGIDSAAAAKKAATEAANQAKEWARQGDTLNESLQRTHNELQAQLDTTTQLTPAEKTLQDILGGTNTAYNHASAALRAKLLAQAQDNAELSRTAIAQQQATKDAEAYAVVQENLQRIALQSSRERQDSLFGIGHGTQLAQDQQALTALQRQYTDLMSQSSRSFIRGDIDQPEYAAQVQAYKAQLAEELKAEQDNFAQRDAMQSDWHNGATAALEDYAKSAANTADQTKSAFASAFQGLEDALVSFTTTGKLNFTSLANSIISDLIRMQIRAAESGIFSQLGSMLGLSAGTGASSIYSLGGSGDTSYLGSGVSSLYGVSGRASGGPTSAGTIYEVAERGPELYQAGGRVYLLSNQNGNVVPAAGVAAGSSAGGSSKVALGGGSNALKVVINNHGTSATDSDVSLQQGGNGAEDILTIVNKQVDNRVNQHAANANSTMVRTLKRTISGRGVPVVG